MIRENIKAKLAKNQRLFDTYTHISIPHKLHILFNNIDQYLRDKYYYNL